MARFELLLRDVRSCTICTEHLPHGPRPVLQVHPSARILIVGQAPGRKVHASGLPFTDASGDRLRDWLGISSETFYDPNQIALLPMGFCYPGTANGGDLPPRPECAKTWRSQLLAQLKRIQFTIVLGQYAIKYHLPNAGTSVTEVVQSWRSHWPTLIPLPHPSPRNNIWLRRNPWFDAELIPPLRLRVAEVLGI